jgi:hypothetical protein
MLHIGLPILAGWLSGGASALGLLYAASGLGMDAGSLILSRIKVDLREDSYGSMTMWGWLVNGLTSLRSARRHSVPYYGIGTRGVLG